MQLRRLSEHHGSGIPRIAIPKYRLLSAAMAPWECRFCKIQNYDDRNKCRECNKSKKFAVFDQAKADAGKARRAQEEQPKANGNRANSKPRRRNDSRARGNSKPPKRVADLEKKLQVERERAEKT